MLAGLLALLGFFAAPPLVNTARVARAEAMDVVYATGVVDYARQARIAPVVAAPLRRVFAEEGAKVAAGALLAQLEDSGQRAAVTQAEAQASIARLSAGRVEQLFASGYASHAALDEARHQRTGANAAVAAARARANDYAIRAPFAGTILRRDAEPGDMATPSNALFVLADVLSLRITADLDERDVARAAVGQNALVHADSFPGRTFDAKVTTLTPQGDSATRVFRVRLFLPADTALRPGMSVEVNIISGRRDNALAAPKDSVRDGAVWVVQGNRGAAPEREDRGCRE
jgi:RND family efflux transporter MFP subunit